MLPNTSTVFFRKFRYEFNENGGNVYEKNTLVMSTAGQNIINRVILAMAETLKETQEHVRDLERALKHEIQCVEACKEELSKKGYYDQLNEKVNDVIIEMNEDLFTRLKNAETANIMLQKENVLLKYGLAQSEKKLEEARGEIYKLQETPTDSALLIEERDKLRYKLVYTEKNLCQKQARIDSLEKALGEIYWSNDSKWQSDRAHAALEELK